MTLRDAVSRLRATRARVARKPRMASRRVMCHAPPCEEPHPQVQVSLQSALGTERMALNKPILVTWAIRAARQRRRHFSDASRW